MTTSRRINAPRTTWNKAETARLVKLYPDTATQKIADALGKPLDRVYGKAARLGLKKSAAYMASPDACRLRRGDNVGQPYRFAKGHVPANKGKKGQPSVGRMAETQFKKGHRGGKALLIYQPIGTERISKDGYLERKINDDMPLQRRWRAAHLILWESVHGPLPKGNAVAFKDGDKTHIALDNLELITRADLMLRNTVHNLPRALAEVVQLQGALNRRINNLTRKNHAHDQSADQ